jgi:hypothetical protein
VTDANMKPDFQRDIMYIVFKLKDIGKYLNQEQLEALAEIAHTIEEKRLAEGRGDLECVVVEHDWPEYEEIWKMIEARVKAESTN